MLAAYFIAIVALGILLWDLEVRAKRAIEALDGFDAQLARSLKQACDESEQRDARLRDALREQEHLIAMLWYKQYGMEHAAEGEYVPSGRLVEVHGLRPRLSVADPHFVTRDFKFTRD